MEHFFHALLILREYSFVKMKGNPKKNIILFHEASQSAFASKIKSIHALLSKIFWHEDN